MEDSGGEFPPEIDEESQAEEEDPTEYTVDRLMRQLQDGFNGCSETTHRDILREHTSDPHVDHHCLNSIFPTSNDFPSVLSQSDILDPEQLANQPIPSPEQWNARFCGTEHPQDGQLPRRVCLHSEETQAVSPDVAFDIDSFLGFATSISVARRGLWYQPAALMKQNITTDVHLEGTRFGHEDQGPSSEAPRPQTVMLRDIPHFLLGRFIGANEITLHVSFPHLPFQGDKFVALSQQQLTTWVDEIFHPAIFDNVPAHVSQHLPASFRQALAVSRARQVEDRKAVTASYQSQQTIGHVIQPEYLDGIWSAVLEKVSQPGLQHFREPQVFLSAKGTKLQFKTNPSQPTLLDAMENYQAYLETTLDIQFVDLDRFYVDVGKEICPRMAFLRAHTLGLDQEPQVYLWRRCCLEHYLHEMYEGRPPKKNGPGQRYYTQNMLHDACTLTSVTPKKSKLRSGGLIYSQFYASCKEVWDASKLMPFENDGLEELALDALVLKSLKRAAGGNPADTKVYRQAYLASKRRAHFSLRDSDKRSFGIREEHRISWALFQAILLRLRARPVDELEILMDDCPSYAWPVRTSTYLNFLWRSLDKFASGFEYIYAQSNRNLVTWEQTKMMSMFLRCLRYVLGGHGLFRESALWWGRREGEAPSGADSSRRQIGRARRRRTWVGLGFGHTLPKYGYAWMEPRFEWSRLQFHESVTELVMFGNAVLRNNYLARGGDVRNFVNATHVLEKGLAWLPRYQDDRHQPIRKQLTLWIIHLILRQFRADVINTLPQAETNHDTREQILNDDVPFNYELFETLLVERVHLTSGNRSIYQHPSQLTRTLFNYNDSIPRHHWENIGYRTMYRRACESIKLNTGRTSTAYNDFRQTFWQELYRSHWIFPVPTTTGLMQRGKNDIGRMWYSIKPTLVTNNPAEFERLHPHLQWEWARKDWHVATPPQLPATLQWTTLQMEEWISEQERRVVVAEQADRI